MSGVERHQVVKSHGALDVAHGIDLAVAPKEFLVLVGPFDCGKSTTLRMNAGLEEISEGILEIDGRVMNRVAPKDRDVAMVFLILNMALMEITRPVTLDRLLHAPAEMEPGQETFRYSGPRAGFYGQLLYCEAGQPTLSREAGFSGVDPPEVKGLDVSTCLKTRCSSESRHRIAILLVPYPAASPGKCSAFSMIRVSRRTSTSPMPANRS